MEDITIKDTIDWEQRQWELAKELYVQVLSQNWDAQDSIIHRKQCITSAILQSEEFISVYKARKDTL